jgi:hypothetical protein
MIMNNAWEGEVGRGESKCTGKGGWDMIVNRRTV